MSAQVQVFPTGVNPMASGLRLDSRESCLRAAQMMVGMRQDAGLTAAFARSLETRIAKVYAAEFAKYRAHEFFPTSTEIDPGALSFTYRMIQRMGNAEVIAGGNARDLPMSSLGGQEVQGPVITIGISYGFSVIEEKSASMAGIAIEVEEAKGAREAIEAFEESVWCQGLAGTGIAGVLNALGVAALPQLSSGTWASQIKGIATATTSNATPPAVVVSQGIAMDIASLKQAITIRTLERQEATNCLLPTNLYQMLQFVPQSPGFNSKSLLTFLEELTGLDIDSWNILMNAGPTPGSTLQLSGGAAQNTAILVYDKDPDVFELMQAQSFIQMAPQLTGLMYSIPCYSRIAGVKSVRPLGAAVMYGLAHNVTGEDVDQMYDGTTPNAVGFAPCKSELDGVMARAY
jgi:hypothetical protein